jgi:hypothetical protein
MESKPRTIYSTNDLSIRTALKKFLEDIHASDKKLRIIEELGVQHGVARIDIAVVNGLMHGYEIKSDKDTLQRLPEQIRVFNLVFDKITLVVGKNHLYEAIQIIPEWWGITIAKSDSSGNVIFNIIREACENENQNSVSIANLLWREEALKILEDNGASEGFYSKSREIIYTRLANVLDQKTLENRVRETLFLRTDWRLDAPLVLNDD